MGGELQSYDTLSDGVIPRHYVDQICHTYVLDTPLFDSIVKKFISLYEKDKTVKASRTCK